MRKHIKKYGTLWIVIICMCLFGTVSNDHFWRWTTKKKTNPASIHTCPCKEKQIWPKKDLRIRSEYKDIVVDTNGIMYTKEMWYGIDDI